MKDMRPRQLPGERRDGTPAKAGMDQALPILQERLYKTGYRPGTLRQTLFGTPGWPQRHIGAGYRRPSR